MTLLCSAKVRPSTMASVSSPVSSPLMRLYVLRDNELILIGM